MLNKMIGNLISNKIVYYQFLRIYLSFGVIDKKNVKNNEK